MLCCTIFRSPAIPAIASAGGKHGRHAATPRPLSALFGVYRVCVSPLGLQAQRAQSPAALQPPHAYKLHPQSLQRRMLSVVSREDLNFAGGRSKSTTYIAFIPSQLCMWCRVSLSVCLGWYIRVSLLGVGAASGFPCYVKVSGSRMACVSRPCCPWHVCEMSGRDGFSCLGRGTEFMLITDTD